MGESARSVVKKPEQKKVTAPTALKRPTLDVGALVRSGVFESAVPTPKRSIPEQLFRNIGMTAERGLLGATAGIIGPGGAWKKEYQS